MLDPLMWDQKRPDRKFFVSAMPPAKQQQTIQNGVWFASWRNVMENQLFCEVFELEPDEPPPHHPPPGA